ncbi:hypothetical protein [Dokdonella sp.]|uniref:hypothetical protein n=1 Tax=Dokdonella sp. TaxID=2291710 RepID=UPI002F3EAFBB
MKLARLHVSGRVVAMLYLCVAVIAPSLVGVAVMRDAAVRDEAEGDTSRMLFAQAVASGMARSAASTEAVLAMLAVDDATIEALGGGDYAGLHARFEGAMEAAGIQRLALHDVAGHEVLGIAKDGAASKPGGGATVRFHRAVMRGGVAIGELEASMPISALADATSYPGAGRVVLSSLSGRLLADAEAGEGGEIVDVPQGVAGAARVPVEAGVSGSNAGHPIAFAVPAGLPIIVTVTAYEAAATAWPWWDLVVLDVLLLAVGWLVVAHAARDDVR